MWSRGFIRIDHQVKLPNNREKIGHPLNIRFWGKLGMQDIEARAKSGHDHL
jgi:hypothetical protein